MELRYMGFDQHGNIREYMFDDVSDGERAVRLVVTADLTLFLKHHISIQEGPAVSARKIAANTAKLGQHDHQLTNQDLLAFAAARTSEVARKAELRRKANRRRGFASRPNS